MKNAVLCITGLILISWCVCIPLRRRAIAENKKGMNLCLKAIPSFLAAALALFVTLAAQMADSYRVWITIGLFLGALGDALMVIRFLYGGVSFFLGHLAYIVAFLAVGKLTPLTAVLMLGVVGVSVFGGRRLQGKSQISRPFLVIAVIYSMTLALMLSLGLSMLWLCPSLQSTLGAVGAFVFVLSDAMILMNKTCFKARPHWCLSLLVYYAAQLLMALSAAAPVLQ